LDPKAEADKDNPKTFGETADVLWVVKPVFDKTSETGRWLRSRIERSLRLFYGPWGTLRR